MKPREFWIFKQNDFDLGFERAMVAEYPHKDTLDGSEIHVIEISAYQTLEARHKKLLDALKKISKDFGTDYADGNTMIAKEAIEADEKAERGNEFYRRKKTSYPTCN